MRERLPWQKFYRAAEEAGFEVCLPDQKGRADFRKKLKQYTGLDPKHNQVRPVYIRGRDEQSPSAFFGKWHGEESAALRLEQQELDSLIRGVCVGTRNMAVNFSHYKGRGVLERIANWGHNMQIQVPAISYNEDRLVTTFIQKGAE